MAIDLVQNSKDAEIAQLKAELEEIQSRPEKVETAPQGTAFEHEEKDDRDLVQKELDTAEEFVIDKLFPNGIRVNSFIKTYLTMKGKTEIEFINEALASFEKYAKPFMSPDGTLILTGKPSELIRLTEPLLNKLSQLIGG